MISRLIVRARDAAKNSYLFFMVTWLQRSKASGYIAQSKRRCASALLVVCNQRWLHVVTFSLHRAAKSVALTALRRIIIIGVHQGAAQMSDLVPIPKRGAPDSPHTSRDIPAAFVPIEQLLPYARNARTHSDAQVAQIAASIVEWGWTNPILADAKGIVAGHGRLAAARLLYSQGRVLHLPSGEDVPAGCVPCIDVSGWSDTARRAYVLADNQLALQAGWDDAMLAEELRSIRDDGFDISLAGFDDIPIEPDFAPGDADEQGKLDEIKPHICPKCGHAFK